MSDQIATQDNLELPSDQAMAMEALLAGKSVIDAAGAAGVSRSTVHRWLKSDPAFRAAFNRWHEEVNQSCKARLINLTSQAYETIGYALSGKNPWVALQLLRATGMLAQTPVGPTDMEQVKRLDSIKTRKQERKLNHLEDRYGTEADDVWPPVFEEPAPDNSSR